MATRFATGFKNNHGSTQSPATSPRAVTKTSKTKEGMKKTEKQKEEKELRRHETAYLLLIFSLTRVT
jgi:hypothetical protein